MLRGLRNPLLLDSMIYAHHWFCATQNISNRQTSSSLSGFILAGNTVSLLRLCQVLSHSISLFKDWSLRQNKNRGSEPRAAKLLRENTDRSTHGFSPLLHKGMGPPRVRSKWPGGEWPGPQSLPEPSGMRMGPQQLSFYWQGLPPSPHLSVSLSPSPTFTQTHPRVHLLSIKGHCNF